jgi:hypothetical protein
MHILSFIIATTLVLFTLSRFSESIENLDCTSIAFHKKLDSKLTRLVGKTHFKFKPIGCGARTFVRGRVKGDIRNE